MSNAPRKNSPALAQLEPFDDPEPGSTWFLSLAGVILLIALVVAVSALNFNTLRTELDVKVVRADADAATLVPKTAVDAEAARELQRTLSTRYADGRLSLAEYTRLSQDLLLNSWMRYPWEDARGQTQQLIRIPIAEAMKSVAEEFAAKSPSKPLASGAHASDSTAPVKTGATNTDSQELQTP